MKIYRVGVSNKSKSAHQRGFTLVELVLVMLVIGIIAAITLPRASGLLDRQNMRRSINVVRGTTRYLQARAALTKRTYRLTLDLDKQTMSACYLTQDTCKKETNRVLRDYLFPEQVQVLDVVGASGEKVEEGEAATHFHPSGVAEASLIHLSGSGSERMTLIIEPLTGRLKVVEGYVVPPTS